MCLVVLSLVEAVNVQLLTQALVFFGSTYLPGSVPQLDLLEDQRKKILSRCAFSIQCCWLRYQRRIRHIRQQSATLIQAGKLLMS